MATCVTRSAARACWVEVKRDDGGDDGRGVPSQQPPECHSTPRRFGDARHCSWGPSPKARAPHSHLSMQAYALNRVILAKANYEPHDGVPRGDKSVRRRAESQWIVAARLLCHLQYPATYLSRLQRIHLPDRLELPFRAPGAAASAASGETLDTCSRGRTSAPTISRVTTGEVESAASSMDSDLEAFSHNPTHGSFAPLAFQPSAMTNYVNQRFLSY